MGYVIVKSKDGVDIDEANRFPVSSVILDSSGNPITSDNPLPTSLEEISDDLTTLNDDRNTDIDGLRGLRVISAMFGRVSDAIVKGLRLDASTEAMMNIGYEHHEIHGGSHYNICDYLLNQANGAIIEFVITTPNTTKWAHMTFEFFSSLGMTIDLYEGASGITGGTAITPQNNNRNFANNSGLAIVQNPTSITDDGNKIDGFLAGAGRSAGFADREKETVFKQNTIYLFRLTSLANSNNISFCGEWYEHTDRN